ncbi:MAG: hypothetical protein EOP53_03965 [Sphingobacteriales bacterium]|nr:MAG: hypothetical protein EOP53_03965 [Sphingobacteriales bacterium]
MKALSFFTILFFMSVQTMAQSFNGNFEGTANGIAASAFLQVAGNTVTGNISINGRPGKVNASYQNNYCEGNLYDIQMQKNYSFNGAINRDTLLFRVTFPELNNQVVQLVMLRLKPVKIPAGAQLSNALIGLWRYTETFSSGSGDNYASFSTDYFMEFKADGTVLSWTGKSAGSAGGQNIEGSASSAEKAHWFTEGKTLYLVDPVNSKKSSLLFYAEANRIMLHNGGKEKKIMIRVQ